MKILFIEDEPEISRMLTDYLSKENFEVICAADGQDPAVSRGRLQNDISDRGIVVTEFLRQNAGFFGVRFHVFTQSNHTVTVKAL